jgi:uncharacterized membrane protein
MTARRLLKHLLVPAWWGRRKFSTHSLAAIERAIADSEQAHAGELRFVVEGPLPLAWLLPGRDLRGRADALFSELRVWDTEGNSGVLVYVNWLDRRVEILADRGISHRVGADFWAAVCRRMEEAFRAGHFTAGVLGAIDEIAAVLRREFPAAAENPNELPDRPLRL